MRDPGTRKTLLAWIAWRVGLSEQAAESKGVSPEPASGADSPGDGRESVASPTDATSRPHDRPAIAFQRRAEQRLRRWHRRIAADAKRFDTLDEAALHSLRKRIKRQRYAAEFFAPALRRKGLKRYLESLAPIQDRMGKLNDLFLARARYQAMIGDDPTAGFALDWIAARIGEVRKRARRELERLARTDPPRA